MRLDLKDLEIYNLARGGVVKQKLYYPPREISCDAWKIYKEMDWQTKRVISDQC